MGCEEYVINKLIETEEKLKKSENTAIKLFHECNDYMGKLSEVIRILKPTVDHSSILGSIIKLDAPTTIYEPEDFAILCDIFKLETKKEEGKVAGTTEDALNE